VTKRDRHFAQVELFKQRFTEVPTEVLKERLAAGILVKEAAIAAREVIEERSERGE
jgi:hypothetical protein